MAGGPELTSHSVSGYSEGVEVNLAGWDGTLRRGKGKERSEKAIIKERKKEEETERTKREKNQKGDVKRGLMKDGKKKINDSNK